MRPTRTGPWNRARPPAPRCSCHEPPGRSRGEDRSARHGGFPMSIQLDSMDPRRAGADGYLFGPRAAWFAFAMTIALMVVDYLDRQVIVSLFPHMKAEWGWTDAQLGSLVSIVSVTVALGALP